MNCGKKSKSIFRKKSGIRTSIAQEPWDKGKRACPSGRRRGASMFCEPAVSGKQYRGNMAAAAAFTSIVNLQKNKAIGLEKMRQIRRNRPGTAEVDGCMIKASMARKSAGHQPDANEGHSRNLCPDAGDTGITQSIGEISTLSISVPEVRSAEKFSDSCSMIVRRKLLQV